MNSINLCDAIQCPYSKKSGCDRYSVSDHCHLMQGRTNIRANQFWLFVEPGDEAIYVDRLKAENDRFLGQDEVTRMRMGRGCL